MFTILKSSEITNNKYNLKKLNKIIKKLCIIIKKTILSTNELLI